MTLLGSILILTGVTALVLAAGAPMLIYERRPGVRFMYAAIGVFAGCMAGLYLTG